MKKRALLILSVFMVLHLFTVSGFQNNSDEEKKPYVILMDGEPVASYTGHIPGFASTQPKRGNTIDVTASAVNQYIDYLRNRHEDALRAAKIDTDQKVYDYHYIINGFSALLTKSQAKILAKQKGIIFVHPDEKRYPTTDASPSFLGISKSEGPWHMGITGENVIVGVIDTGIWPEHPSFFDDGSYAPLNLTLLDTAENPSCHFGNESHNPMDKAFQCNNKLLGSRSFLKTYKKISGIDPNEFDSSRDDDGHGTHTASTAAGALGVDASINGLYLGKVSGIAPRARIIAYKACASKGCYSSDLSAAIDQAVADGVMVINYSIGGGASLIGLDELAFLRASNAGVFAATSAGNSGPSPETVGGPATAPWITAVGASTHNRAFISDITVTGPKSAPEGIWGCSVTKGVDGLILVDAEGIADTKGDISGKCLNPFPEGSFPANTAVLCNQYDFGIGRTTRSKYVKEGGASAVLFHNSENVSVLPTDNHIIPAVHMAHAVGEPLKAYLRQYPGQVTIRFTPGSKKYAKSDQRVKASTMASFSSRGWNKVALDIIKPDITAPGVSILAGASPYHSGNAAQGELFQSIMGTSMSSPHVAGIFALIKQVHPDWTPAMAKSALMTTSRQDAMKESGMTLADPFDMGAGYVAPGFWLDDDMEGSLFDPGLVYNATDLDYLGFLCDAAPEAVPDPEGTCAYLKSNGTEIKAINLNLPSMGIAQLAGSETIVRTVTNASKKKTLKLKAFGNPPPGFDMRIEPETLKLKKGESLKYRITFTNNGNATIGEWSFGSISWYGDDYRVYSPIALRAQQFDAPQKITGSGPEGSLSFDVKFGYTGAYNAVAHGLEPAVMHQSKVLQDPDQEFTPSDVTEGTAVLHTFTLNDAILLRAALPPESTEKDADLDIFVYNPEGKMVASSTKSQTDELVSIENPMDGDWKVYVHGWLTPEGDSEYKLLSWVLQNNPGTTLEIIQAPLSASIGEKGTITVNWKGVATNIHHLGAVSHNHTDGVMGLTLIEISPK